MSFVRVVVERRVEVNFVVEVGENVEPSFEDVVVPGESLDEIDSQAEAKQGQDQPFAILHWVDIDVI